MKMVHSSQLILIAAFLILTCSTGLAVVGPEYHEQPDDTPAPAAPIPVKPKLKPAPPQEPKVTTVDQIKGIGKFQFGAKVSDFPPTLLQPVDPRARGKLLRVSPYGQNYLVTNLTGLTWGNIPLTGLIVTFHDNYLIDIQMALKAKKVDFYLAERAFKDKYGPNNPKTFPVEGWSGDRIQVTLVVYGAILSDPGSLDKLALGKVDLFDAGQWAKVQAAQKVKLEEVLNKRYQDEMDKVKANL
jgi:hypothetical protein